METNTPYRDGVLRTARTSLSREDQILNAVLGLAGEAGEVADLIKKWKFHDHEFQLDKLVNELGDVMFYTEWLCSVLGVTAEHVQEKNLDKLRKRYPEGFSSEASINREEVAGV